MESNILVAMETLNTFHGPEKPESSHPVLAHFKCEKSRPLCHTSLIWQTSCMGCHVIHIHSVMKQFNSAREE